MACTKEHFNVHPRRLRDLKDYLQSHQVLNLERHDDLERCIRRGMHLKTAQNVSVRNLKTYLSSFRSSEQFLKTAPHKQCVYVCAVRYYMKIQDVILIDEVNREKRWSPSCRSQFYRHLTPQSTDIYSL